MKLGIIIYRTDFISLYKVNGSLQNPVVERFLPKWCKELINIYRKEPMQRIIHNEYIGKIDWDDIMNSVCQ